MNPGMIVGISLGMIVFGGLAILVIYVMMERNKNVSRAIDHMWFQIIPKAGMERNYRIPIEHNGGVTFSRIPDIHGKFSNDSPIHIMGEEGEFDAVYPPGKMKFVQVPMKKIIFYEGDIEPLSNVSNIPIVSGQLVASLINGLCASVADVVRKSQQQDGQQSKGGGLMLLYILVGVGALAAIVAAVMAVKASGNTGDIPGLINLVKQALGIK